MSEALVAEVKTIIVHKRCDWCGGLMEYQSNVPALTSYPMLYAHICNNCGLKSEYRHIYPYYTQIPIEELRDPTGDEIKHIRDEVTY